MGVPPKPKLAELKTVTTPKGVVRPLTQRELDRLWAHVREDAQGCWIWSGRRYPSGYGGFSLGRETTYTHRIMYMIFVGEIARGLHTDHLCRIRECCNPDHLEAVTCRENVMRSPIQLMAINARKTHCKRGHPLSGENLHVNKDGGRVCRACVAERARLSYAKKVGKAPEEIAARRASDDVCVNGHALDDTTSFTDPRGSKRCRICAREAQRRWREKKKENGS